MNKTICAFAILLAGCIAAAAQNSMQSQKGITVSKAPPEVVKEIAPIVGGAGGGRPDFAEAGGKQPEKIDEMLAASEAVVARLLGG